jgi:hypothetical protein
MSQSIGIYLQQSEIRIAQAKCPGLPQPAPGQPDPYTIIIDAAATAGVAIFAYFLVRDIVHDRRHKAAGEGDEESTEEDDDDEEEEGRRSTRAQRLIWTPPGNPFRPVKLGKSEKYSPRALMNGSSV